MIEELKKQIISNLIDIIDDKGTDKIEELGSIKVGSMQLGKGHSSDDPRDFFASLRMDCQKLPERNRTLNYCVGFAANVFPARENKFGIHNFFVQEQVGISHGFPVHSTITDMDSDQVLLVLLTFNKELSRLNPKSKEKHSDAHVGGQQVDSTYDSNGVEQERLIKGIK